MDKTILVVDDDASIREVVSICMRREGFEVIQAKNGMEAWTSTPGPGWTWSSLM